MMGWKEKTAEVIAEIIKEKELYENAVFLAENAAGKKTGSVSVCLWERDYPFPEGSVSLPEKNFTVVNLSEKAKTNELKLVMGINMQRTGVLSDVPQPADMVMAEAKNVYWSIPADSENFAPYLKTLIGYAIDIYESHASVFGCCSRFMACSDAGKCLHENRLYAKACSYRKNLESGRVFYGSNKNT